MARDYLALYDAVLRRGIAGAVMSALQPVLAEALTAIVL
jgi:hypothetical protein